MSANVTERYARTAEAFRRGAQGHVDTGPAPFPEAPGVGAKPLAVVGDYAGPLTHVAVALAHLDEALPAQQGDRAYNAFMLLRAGVEELAVWLRARGVEV